MMKFDLGGARPRQRMHHALADELGLADLAAAAGKGLAITAIERPGEPLLERLTHEVNHGVQHSLIALMAGDEDVARHDFVLILRSAEWTQILEVDPFYVGDDEPLLLVSRDQSHAFCWQAHMGLIPCPVPSCADRSSAIKRGRIRVTAAMIAFAQFPELCAA